MYRKVKNYLEMNKMLLPGDTVLMGVSGGGDSMAMLHMLCRLKSELKIELKVIHVHHGIRGDEAERDCELVRETCETWNVPCAIYRYEVPVLAKKWKMGIEEAGRAVRKEAFRMEIEKGDSSERVKIALAHNKNDLAETMLHNLARGTGLRGLTGIRPVTEDIIRPLLCLERKEIDEYLLNENIPYVIDSTNLEDHYTRNRIRHHVLPVMQQEINPQALEHMAAAAEKIAAADHYLRKEAAVFGERFRVADKKYLLTEDFWRSEQILKQYAVMEILAEIAGQSKNLTQLHVEQVLESERLQTGKCMLLPYNIVVKKEYEGIAIGRKPDEAKEKIESCEWKVPLKAGETVLKNTFSVNVFPYNGQKICEKKYTKWFDYDKIQEDLSLRTRKTGDYVTIDQTGKRKKLTRYMIDEKIPKENRDSVILLTSGSEVLWVLGGRISEKYKITEGTKRILEITYKGGIDDGGKNQSITQ